MIWFAPKITNSSPTKMIILIWKLIPTITVVDVQYDEEVVMEAEDNEVTLTEDEIGNPFQDTSSENELGNKWLKASLQALQEEPSSSQNLPTFCIFKNMINANSSIQFQELMLLSYMIQVLTWVVHHVHAKRS